MSSRKTTQHLMPARVFPKPAHYDIYPSFPLSSGEIELGFEALVTRLQGYSRLIIDGYAGVLWEDFRERFGEALRKQNVIARWINVNTALKSKEEIEALVQPFLGGDDPIFGTRFTGELTDFFDVEKLPSLRPDSNHSVNILYGSGASLANWSGSCLVYLDLPKNELQFRARTNLPTNLGVSEPLPAKAAYKRSYFVDWPVLNSHKALLSPHIDFIVDTQRPDAITFMSGDTMREGLEKISYTFFRVRPWFEPGAWGGQWIKNHIPELEQDVPNYAWSFELITPENGLVFESDGPENTNFRLELSFDFLMYLFRDAVLGEAAERFKYEFPIRFDWLDTIDGGNLSVQCHPSVDYIRKHFGETFTQDETYYILECKENTSVYLGFQEDINANEFRENLEQSSQQNISIDIETFVQRHDAEKHDLFLIPNGTIHCAGEGCMVLEISATPYIFTFKMYDWLRLDLDGKPRPLNIDRAFDNLNFEHQGEKVKQELISSPSVLSSGEDWRIVHLPTHEDHFYDVERLEFTTSISQRTNNQCHVLAVVEGESVLLETDFDMRQRFYFAETFVVPAAANGYKLINEGKTEAKVVKAFVKSDKTKLQSCSVKLTHLEEESSLETASQTIDHKWNLDQTG
jgi:mannose-6-phosphate isomerase class I